MDQNQVQKAFDLNRRTFLQILTATLALPASLAAKQASRNAAFPAIDLRGYGPVSGILSTPAPGASLLTIQTSSPAQAAVLHAKFLSDFTVFPDIQLHGGILEVPGQGIIAALHDGTSVFLLAAQNPQGMQALRHVLPSTAVAAPTAEVPMYLDRWDRFNFRHYYRPWTHSPDTSEATYDFPADFDWAAKEERSGFLISQSPMATDSADNMLNTTWNGYVDDESLKRKLPIDVHLGAGAGSEPTWFVNRFPDQIQKKMPGFTGNFHELMTPYLGGQGVLSWNSTTGEAARLSLLQDGVRHFNAEPNVTSYLEPHGELHHGAQDIFLEYGPVADAGYQIYLKQKYGTPQAVAARWHMPLSKWADVRVPEIATFAGWGPDAHEITGPWRIAYEELQQKADEGYNYNARVALKSTPAPEEWFHTAFDDAAWPQIPGAGNDLQLFLPKRPAVLRQTFDLPADYKSKHPRLWLYLWDLNTVLKAQGRVVLNDVEVDHSAAAPLPFSLPLHRTSIEVTDALRPGNNTLAVRLPLGFIAYKTYLSPIEPKSYPGLGEALNAQWVDFIDFTAWSRVEIVKRGIEMIRQVAPNTPITIMHPDEYSDGIKNLCIAYGAEFHNTGYMGGIFADYNTSLMRGANLPYSIEPSAPPKNFDDYKHMWGLYQLEGIQAIDFFIHIGDILWHPDIRAHYEAHRTQIALMGQTHFVKAQVACLYSDRVSQLTGYPWGSAPNTNLGGGYWSWNAASVLRGVFPYDGLSESSFSNTDADAYKVVIDSNTSIMDVAFVARLETWIRGGGTFITLAQTGRHTPERPDTWPIARLTGYKVTHIDRLKEDGAIDQQAMLAPAPGQAMYDASWFSVTANGLHLEKQAADATNLLLWSDGSVAAGMRPLGRGFIIQLGCKFTGSKIYDRVEPGGDTPEAKLLRRLLTPLLDHAGIARETGRIDPPNEQVWIRPSVTNNGIYDVWTIFNWSTAAAHTVNIELPAPPAFALEGRDFSMVPVTGKRIENIALDPLETRVFLTPRNQIANSPAAWFDLQRKWWRGTTRPDPKPLPKLDRRFIEDLSNGWTFQTAHGAAATRTIGIWDVRDHGKEGHGIFRRTFSVPAQWRKGKVSLWLTSWNGSSFVDNGRVLLDGHEVKPMNPAAYIAIDLKTLAPGSTHTLAVEIESAGTLAGFRGQSWLAFEPETSDRIDLAGKWEPSIDGLHFEAPVEVPGHYKTQFLRRSIFVDARYKGKSAMLTVDGDHTLVCALVNGRLFRRHHHMIGERWSLNVIESLRPGEQNEIAIVRWDGAGNTSLREVSLNFYDPTFYP